MAQQERAVQTRHAVLEAAAAVFAEEGFTAARISTILETSGLTRGALYFHFDSKEALAKGVLELQTALDLPPRRLKMQELVDTVMVVAHRLPRDVVLRAGARLSEDPKGRKVYGSAGTAWIEVLMSQLSEAERRGELLPHVVLRETAEVVLTAFQGARTYSQLESNLSDMEERASILLRHLLPSIVVPPVLANLDTAPERGARIYSLTTAEHGSGAVLEG